MKAKGVLGLPGNRGADQSLPILGVEGFMVDSLLRGLVGRGSQDTDGCPLIHPPP